MKRSTILVLATAILAATLGLLWGQWSTTPRSAESGAAGALLNRSLPDANGQSHDLAQWKNKPLVVNFWATWCAPCVEEMPELSELQADIAPAGMQILGIGIDSAENIAQFASKHGISYPLYVGGVNATELARSLGNRSGGLPFTVLIDANGEVRKSYLGRLKMEELRADLASL